MKKNKSNILNPKTDWVFKLMFSKGEEDNKALISFLNAFLIIEPATFYRGSGVAEKGGKAVLKVT